MTDRKPSRLSRREWLKSTSALGVVAASSNLLGCDDSLPPLPTDLPTDPYTGAPGPASLFTHGVASGDPLEDGFVIWTRVTPADLGSTVEVFYEVALDPDFVDRVEAGTTMTGAAVDFTAKLDVRGLVWGRDYYYRFSAQGRTSMVGRARCAPKGGEAKALRFAVTSCASYGHGYFHAYRRIAEREDLDAVLHLGDYIYEYGTGEYGSVREYEPAHEIVTLADYRMRFAQYRRDPDLQALHQQHPVIPIWDDHESANDSYEDGAENHQLDTEGTWTARKQAARQAYFEWMPIRDPGMQRIYRTLRYGNLADIVLLDTRLEGRDLQFGSTSELPGEAASRSLLGAEQEAWLDAELDGRALWHPIPDLHAPSFDATVTLVDDLVGRLRAGASLLVHCAAGIGRTGTIATCVLVALGVSADEATRTVAEARPGAGPEVGSQRDLVEQFAARLR